MPLPLKEESVALPDNKEVALNRLSKLKRMLKTDSKYRKDYLAFMSNLIECGHAERVPTEEVVMKNGQVWYIRHHEDQCGTKAADFVRKTLCRKGRFNLHKFVSNHKALIE